MLSFSYFFHIPKPGVIDSVLWKMMYLPSLFCYHNRLIVCFVKRQSAAVSNMNYSIEGHGDFILGKNAFNKIE